MWTRFLICAVGAALVTTGCATRPPDQVYDACLILEDNRAWWRDLRRTESRYGVSPGVQLAILKRESSFEHNARPARRRLLGVVPWSRPSSAYGYAQALDSTWDWYRDETGRRGADRDDFGDAVDFIGWYNHQSGRLAGISPDDPYSLYLAYHEGHGGFSRRTYSGKSWLIRAAREVETDARRYDAQINGCQRRLNRNWIPFL